MIIMYDKYQKVTIVALGDGITDDSVRTEHIAPYETHWYNLVKLQTGIRLINSGVVDNTTKQMKDRFDTDVLQYHPQYCIIQGGLNDLAKYFDSETTDKDDYSMDKIIERLADICNTCRKNNIIPIIMSTPAGVPSYATGDWKTNAEQAIDGLRSREIGYARNSNQRYIDLCNTLVYSDKTYRPYDNVHASQAGQMILAEEILRSLDHIIPHMSNSLSNIQNV